MTQATLSVELMAPINGQAIDLAQTLDPLINQGLMGSGIAIEPIGNRIVAPCNGIIDTIAATGHQLTIISKHGVSIRIIIGHDGLATHGVGYHKKVEVGSKVTTGQTLIELDTLKLKKQLKSMTVAVLVTKGALKLLPQWGSKRAGEDLLLKVIIKKTQIKE